MRSRSSCTACCSRCRCSSRCRGGPGAASRRSPRATGSSCSGSAFSGYYLASFLDFLGLQYISAEPRATHSLSEPHVRARHERAAVQAHGDAPAVAGAASSAISACSSSSGMTCRSAARTSCSARCWCSAAPSATRCTCSSAGRRSNGSAPCASPARDEHRVRAVYRAVLRIAAGSAMVVAPEVIWLSLLNATLCTFLPWCS